MKSVWNSFKAAFAMFSKIPTPMVDWNKENILLWEQPLVF